MLNKLVATAAFATALVASVGMSQAATISGLYNTGVDNTGAVVTGNGADLHWQLGGGNAYTGVTNGSFPAPPWLADNSVSRWITPAQNAAVSFDPSAPGSYTYTLNFNLTASQAAGASFLGQFAADNIASFITLNSTTLGSNTGGFQSWTSFSALSTAFIAGTNTLSFTILNFQQNGGNPSGFRAEFLSSTAGPADAAGVVPLPAAFPLFATGAGLMGLLGWRRKRKVKTALASA